MGNNGRIFNNYSPGLWHPNDHLTCHTVLGGLELNRTCFRKKFRHIFIFAELILLPQKVFLTFVIFPREKEEETFSRKNTKLIVFVS